MLPSHYRLRRTRDFSRARRFGRSSGTSVATLYLVSTRSPEVHIGFSVSKRVGKAHVRNRVKRRLREAVRPHLPAIYAGQNLVFIARPAAAEASFPQLCGAVAALLQKTGAVSRVPERPRNA